jgi:hypothetical protein
MAKEELARVSGHGQRASAQRDLSREARERTRDHRPYRRQDAQEPHPRADRRQGAVEMTPYDLTKGRITYRFK